MIAGDGQPAAVHALVHAINRSLGNVGSTVEYIPPVEAEPVDQLASLERTGRVDATGKVDLLLIVLGGNPVYNAPGELEFAKHYDKVKLRVHLSDYVDETSFLSHWHIPVAHDLESWGDARAFDGTASIQQPLIAPLYQGRTAYELLAMLSGHPELSTYRTYSCKSIGNNVLGDDGFRQSLAESIARWRDFSDKLSAARGNVVVCRQGLGSCVAGR